MELNDYQKKIEEFRLKDTPRIQYPTYRLVGDIGNITNLFAYSFLRKKGKFDKEDTGLIKKYLSNALQDVSLISSAFGFTLEDVANEVIKDSKHNTPKQ